MGLFKTEEEKREKEKEKIREWEEIIRDKNRYYGRVGHIHQGLSTFGVWGTMSNNKTKFKETLFDIYDDKIIIQRNRNVIQISEIKEIIIHNYEAIILLNSGDGIPIAAPTVGKRAFLGLKAFINILNEKIENQKPSINNESDQTPSKKSEDKMDKLIKLGEMYKEGLLTDEEFALMKKELLSGNHQDTTPIKNNIEPSDKICENCGAEYSEEDNFCNNCGTNLNN